MKKVISAGGIVYKKVDGKTFFLLIQHSMAGHWSFPKGHVGDNVKDETLEQAAIRETLEEGGVKAEIIYYKPYTNSYFLTEDGIKAKKTVYYFLMEFKSGSTTLHDQEVSEAVFLDYNNALESLTYPIDKELLKKAVAVLKKLKKI